MTAKLPIGYDHNFGTRQGKVHVAFTNRGLTYECGFPTQATARTIATSATVAPWAHITSTVTPSFQGMMF